MMVGTCEIYSVEKVNIVVGIVGVRGGKEKKRREKNDGGSGCDGVGSAGNQNHPEWASRCCDCPSMASFSRPPQKQSKT